MTIDEKKIISPSYALGIEGEDMAADYLSSSGYVILERRFRIHSIEIDIIASKGKELVFVEVKTRSSDFFASPESAVNVKKQKRMILAADYYVRERGIDAEIRFDIVSVVRNRDTEHISHIKNAFPPFV
ncbi:MAG: YraN family protein [Flavobacteriales bacterium]|jgi:UPF0102 protein PI23P_03032|nr:YraN family protein [Flavobacteriales bacterium]PWM09628.1 MAG: YraN family protein [Flavobacteriales bacterium]